MSTRGRHGDDRRVACDAEGRWHPPGTAYVLTRTAVREVDRCAVEEYGIPGAVLMENAARGLADAALTMLSGSASGSRPPAALIVCGSGNNGGDGYALARHLHNADVRVTLMPLKLPRNGTDAAVNRAICDRMDVPVISPEQRDEIDPAEIDLLVDAIFGTGLDRAVEGEAAEVIKWIKELSRPVLAVDVPSGIDCETGLPLGVAVRARRTVTFVALKPGFLEFEAQRWLGEVTVADIGAPVDLVRRLGRPLPERTADAPGR